MHTLKAAPFLALFSLVFAACGDGSPSGQTGGHSDPYGPDASAIYCDRRPMPAGCYEDDGGDPPVPTLDVRMAAALRWYTNMSNHARRCQLAYTLPQQPEVVVFDGIVQVGETPTTGVVVRLTAPGEVMLSGRCENDAGGWDRKDVRNWVTSSMTCSFLHWPEGIVQQHCAP